MKGYEEKNIGPDFDEELKGAKNEKPWENGPGYVEGSMPDPEQPWEHGPGRDENGDALPENSGVEIVPERDGPGV